MDEAREEEEEQEAEEEGHSEGGSGSGGDGGGGGGSSSLLSGESFAPAPTRKSSRNVSLKSGDLWLRKQENRKQ